MMSIKHISSLHILSLSFYNDNEQSKIAECEIDPLWPYDQYNTHHLLCVDYGYICSL